MRDDTASRLPGSTASVGNHADQHLAGVGAAEQPDERVDGVLDAMHDRFLGSQRSIAQPSCCLCDVLIEELVVIHDEVATQRESVFDRVEEVRTGNGTGRALAVGTVPILTLIDTPDAHYRRFGAGVRRFMPTYADEWPSGGTPVAEHHADSAADSELERRARHWDQLAVQAVLRDRHPLAALGAVLRR